jgi:hypothetical protein
MTGERRHEAAACYPVFGAVAVYWITMTSPDRDCGYRSGRDV